MKVYIVFTKDFSSFNGDVDAVYYTEELAQKHAAATDANMQVEEVLEALPSWLQSDLSEDEEGTPSG